MNPIHILVEGETDAHVAMRLLHQFGLEIGNVYGKKGKAYLLAQLSKYNQAGRFGRWLAVVDLDNDAPCASQAINQWLTTSTEGMILRVAVQAVEAWLLADTEGFARFFGIPLSRLPDQTDLEHNPKDTVVNLVRRSSKRSLREDMVPRHGSGAKVGPLYSMHLIEFVDHHWRPDAAANHSDSLRRCIQSLRSL
jgi:hypothetical protein